MKKLLCPALAVLLSGIPCFAQESPDEARKQLVAALEKKVLYHPRKYAAGVIAKFKASGGRRLDYTTSLGGQSAWLITPVGGAAPEKLWLVCGGNGTLALEMEPLCRSLPGKRDAWLLVDYPGYGECNGEPSPAGIRENLKIAVLQTTQLLNLDAAKRPAQLCVFGHSLGCAAALLAVEEFQLRSAVLCAPFTSTAEMAQQKFGIPKDIPLQHLYDNRSGLAALQKNHGRAWILHGDVDNVIPVSMSKTLAAEFKDTVTMHAIAGAGHNDIFRLSATQLAKAFTEARK